MCGIFGIHIDKNIGFDDKSLNSIIEDLFLLSESRGKEASGICVKQKNSMDIYKSKKTASEFIKTKTYKNIISSTISDSLSINLFGHSRLVTDGTEESYNNNQPAVKNGLACVHNGIIVNSTDLWNKYKQFDKTTELDTEVFIEILKENLTKTENLIQSIRVTYEICYGMASVACFFNSYDNLLLSTNNGSIYYINNNNSLIFASEFYILNEIYKKHRLEEAFGDADILQLEPNHALLLDTQSGESELKNFDDKNDFKLLRGSAIKSEFNFHGQGIEDITVEKSSFFVPNEFSKIFNERQNKISLLKRCTKCLLPETFPLIHFDKEGVCNYCKKWKPISALGSEHLEKDIHNNYKVSKFHDSIVALSGGRDSSYSLHYVVEELGMKPIAYSYDWGMITDLARRNQSRLCGKLGVEHIMVSADIRKKRKNIQKNVLAWLKKPELGTIPLFMAGDKQYFYYAYQLQKQNDLDLLILGENHFEKTSFKSAFSGARQENKGSMAYNINSMNKLRMLFYYAKIFVSNPAFINSSIVDTASAFASYYLLPHKYLNLYDYIMWDEKVIEDTLINEYDWELSPDTTTTWRIGDGTAPFYNYIYYMVAGFSELETFRSNQIRENVITRDEGLELIFAENKPRWESIKWYCDTIGINFEDVIRRINQIQKLYV